MTVEQARVELETLLAQGEKSRLSGEVITKEKLLQQLEAR